MQSKDEPKNPPQSTDIVTPTIFTPAMLCNHHDVCSGTIKASVHVLPCQKICGAG